MKTILTPFERRRTERGGLTILVVFTLLAFMSVAAFGLSRNTVREMAITGTTWQAAKAGESADAGLDWYMVWTHPANLTVAAAGGRQTLKAAFTDLTSDVWSSSPYLLDRTKTWDRAVKVTSTEGTANSDMVFSTSGTEFLQSAAKGNKTQQSYDLAVRFLGMQQVQGMTSLVEAGQRLQLFQAQVEGRASVDLGGGNFMRYRATRESLVRRPPS